MRNPGVQARKRVQEGMRTFLDGNVEASVAKFDQALALDPSYKPKLWQRGLSLYYTKQYAEAAEQFRCDVAYNPNDTEEALWTFLSESQLVGPQKARKDFLLVGKDPRPLLRTVYDVYRNAETTSPDEILQVARTSYSAHDEFYSNLYAALWYESMGKGFEDDAKRLMLQSLDTRYALQSGDYMCGLAEVHCKVRKWQ
jgi:tetratricopeptide (TPR) repeat protein